MTLLDATATLIDLVKTWAPQEDAHTKRAIRRMERRLDVLRLRAAKSLRRRRSKGWKDLQFLAPKCVTCGEEFCFGDFVKKAELNHRGDIIRYDCPSCGAVSILLEVDGKCSRYLVMEAQPSRLGAIAPLSQVGAESAQF